MSSHENDLDDKLKALPDVPPMSPMVSASVRRKARIAFLESSTSASVQADGSLVAATWTRTVLPLLLLLAGALYTVNAVAGMAQVYLGN